MTAQPERGFALLIVLWTLVFLAFLMTQVLATGRAATALAENMRAAAEAKATADGAINDALFHLLSNGADHWPPDCGTHVTVGANVMVSVRICGLDRQINPNLASRGLLAGLFQAIGAAPVQAGQLADAIVEWRGRAATKQQAAARVAAYRRGGYLYGPPGHPFADLGELNGVMGMPPSLFAKALPEMSLYQPNDPDPAVADGVVRRALALSGQIATKSPARQSTPPVVSIVAEAKLPGGVVSRRKAIVNVEGNNAAETYGIIQWTDD